MWKTTCLALAILSLTACGSSSTTDTKSVSPEQQKRELEKKSIAFTPGTLKDNKNVFDSTEPVELIVENLKLRNEERATEIINKSMVFLGTLTDAVDEKTHKVMTARDLNKESYLTLESYRLGLSLGDFDFEKHIDNIEKELDTKAEFLKNSSHWHRPMLTTYSWVNGQVLHKMFDYPNESTMVASSAGLTPSHNPFTINNYLKGKTSETDFLKQDPETGEFWVGMRNYLDGNKTGAKYHLETYLTNAKKSNMGFELAASTKLINQMSAQETK